MKTILALNLVFLSWVHAAPAQWADYLAPALAKSLPKDARVEVKDVRISIPLQGRVRFQSIIPELPLGIVQFEVQSLHEGKVTQGRGTANVRAYVPVAVATAPLSHGEKLTDANTRFDHREISRLVQAGYFTDRTALGERTARGAVGAGQVLGKNNTQLPAVVNSGQFVDLVRRSKGITLRAKVRALQNGRLDQWIGIQNPSSQKILQAKVVGPNEVEVF